MKYIFFFSLLTIGSCQKYTCQCEGVNDANYVTLTAPHKEDIKKTSYGLAEKECIKKGNDIGQNCYIVID